MPDCLFWKQNHYLRLRYIDYVFLEQKHVDDFVEDCGNSIAHILELLQTYTKSSM